MSLPPASRDISEHPSKGSVTDPVNKDQLHADVDRKLRFYGVIQAFRAGRLPDNAQIDETLRYVAEHSPVDMSKLSPAGKRLVKDTRDIIETARLMVKEKNADELFQNFVWHTQAVDVSAAKRDPSSVPPLSPEKTKADTEQAAHHLRTLLTLLLTNAEARKLFSDFSVVGRDLLARSVDMIRPSDEELRRVDEPVGEREQKHAGDTNADTERELKVDHDGPRKEIDYDGPIRDNVGLSDTVDTAHENLRGVAQDGRGVGVHRDGRTSADVQTGDREASTTDTGTTRDQSQAKAQAQNGVNGTGTGTSSIDVNGTPSKERAKQTFKERVAGLRDRVPQVMSQEQRDKANNLYDRAKTFMDEEYFPRERRERFVYRGKKVILECQKDTSYQESISWLLDTLAAYGTEGVRAAGDAGADTKRVWGHGTLKDASTEVLLLLSRFAENRSMQPLLDAVQGLYDVAREDKGLRKWFGGVREWGRRTLLEPGYVLDPQCTREGTEIREKGRKYFDDKYKAQFDALFDAVGDWFTALTHDPLNTRFAHDWARLTRDLLFDSEGSLTWKPELWADVRRVIVPEVVDKVGYIPIPRAEFTDDDLDLVIENLTLSGRNLFPNIVSVEAHNFAKFSPYSTIQDESRHNFVFTLGQMQADMRDVMFYFNKKTGVPKLKDSGLADVLIGGEGITATIHLTNAGKDASSIFHITSIHVKVDTLKFSIRDSKHDALYKFLRPFATGIVKRQVQRALRDAIRTALELIDQQLVRVRNRMGEAREREELAGEEAETEREGGRTEALKELFKRQTDEASAKAKEKQEKRQSHFKVVAKRDSLLLPEQGHPQGWVNRQQHEADLVKQGHEWRSKAFTIVPQPGADPAVRA